MAQYMDPLIRSGAMWSCGRQRNTSRGEDFGQESGAGWEVAVPLHRLLSSFAASCSGRESHGTEEGVFGLPGIKASLLDDDRNVRLDDAGVNPYRAESERDPP